MRQTKIRMAEGGDLYFRYALADRLHITQADIERMTIREIEEWKAYLSLEAERAENAERLRKQAPG